MVDGNGDTFDNWYQWANPDRSGEYLRHAGRANVARLAMPELGAWCIVSFAVTGRVLTRRG